MPDSTVSGAEAGNVGTYVGGGSTAQGHPLATGAIGIFKMPVDWATVRGGVFGADKDGIGVGGVEGGVRLHTTNRFSPYAGISGDLGFSSLHSGYRRHQTNPLMPYKTNITYGLAAIAPEAGISYWLNNSTRLNAGASYYFALDQPQFLVFGISLDYVLGDGWPFINSTASKNDPQYPKGERDTLFSDSTDDATSEVDRVVRQAMSDLAEETQTKNAEPEP